MDPRDDVDPRSLVTVASFDHAFEAHLCRDVLEEAGIWSFVADEHTAGTQYYSVAVGGVKLMVRHAEHEQAAAILERVQRGEESGEGLAPESTAPPGVPGRVPDDEAPEDSGLYASAGKQPGKPADDSGGREERAGGPGRTTPAPFPPCPGCGSEAVERSPGGLGEFVADLFTGRLEEPYLGCGACGHRWRPGDEG